MLSDIYDYDTLKKVVDIFGGIKVKLVDDKLMEGDREVDEETKQFYEFIVWDQFDIKMYWSIYNLEIDVEDGILLIKLVKKIIT